MSSHREAPEISKDPVADNADVYAFVSPEKDGTVTIVTNFVPLQGPAAGPNFYEFGGNDVLYSIYIDNNGDGAPDIEYQFTFNSTLQNNNTFLYNTGPITSLTSPNWNARQFYTLNRIDAGKVSKPTFSSAPGPAWGDRPTHATQLGTNLPCPPCNVGPRSTPNYEANLGSAAVQTLATGEKVFAGQRWDPFYVDLGSIFDLGALRPFNPAHLIPLAASAGVDATKGLNIHTIAIKVPINKLTKDGSTPTNVASATSVLGIWSTASRYTARMFQAPIHPPVESGPWAQVSRLGNPLFNEVIVPISQKDQWNRRNPEDDATYLPNVQKPEVAGLLPVLYPGVFPKLAALSAPRADLVAILLTGIPTGIIPGFQNFSSTIYADMLRLNVAVPPSASPNALGILGGGRAGFPNGRRLADDIVAIELRAIAGATYPLVAPSYVPDAAASALTQGIPVPATDGVGARYLTNFPYVGAPLDGYDNPPV